MKKPLSLILILGTAVAVSAGTFDQTHQIFEQALKQFVKHGRVDYAGLKASPAPLAQYLLQAGQVTKSEFNGWTEEQQLSFLINLYNASTLQLILDHYPVSSIKKIRKGFKGPWDLPSVTLHGESITLNDLEHGIIRRQYNEPRIHMALVCAAKGCPMLRSEAYTAERLNDQLDDQSRRYLATSAGLVVDRNNGTASISSIFKWYGDDYESVPAFIEKYSAEDINGLKLRYLHYDWSLNAR